jgi:multifunctional methyltransferase subunit TRM112
VKTIKCEDSPVDREFLLNMLPKVNYPALRKAVQQISPHCDPPLPEIPENVDVANTESNQNLDATVIANLHKVMFDVYLVEGWLICPDTGRRFPVKDSIPNMILHEDEI